MWTDDDGRRTPDHGYTISSPCEPEGSGELKMGGGGFESWGGGGRVGWSGLGGSGWM